MLLLVGGGCSQFPFESPNPGTIRVFLTTRADSIQVNATDLFYVSIEYVRVVRSDGPYADVFDSVDQRFDTPDTLNLFRILHGIETKIGEMYLPPARYVQVRLKITSPAAAPLALRGIIPIDTVRIAGRLIPLTYVGELFTDLNDSREWDPGEPFVDRNRNGRYDATYDPVILIDHTFEIKENQLTEVHLEFDADHSLIRRAEGFDFYPVFRVR